MTEVNNWVKDNSPMEWEASGPIRVHRHVSDPGEGVKGKICVVNTGQTDYELERSLQII